MDSDGHHRPLSQIPFNRGYWLIIFLILVGCCLAAWWEHHVWIASSLSFAAAFMLNGRQDVHR